MLAITQLECVRGERRLFANLSFELAPHNLLQVRGANGSGKTSLLRNLCGLLPPAAGTIKWNGSDIHTLGEEYRAQIAWLGHLSAVKDELTARENLLFSARASGLAASAPDVDAALHKLGIDGFDYLPCKALSQGQHRRVALARLCLCAGRALWILDEPFTALDAAAVSLTRELLESHLRAGGMVVLTTHQDVAISARATRNVELGL
jgi:heme exporter protein A